jgi:hypothetical protein
MIKYCYNCCAPLKQDNHSFEGKCYTLPEKSAVTLLSGLPPQLKQPAEDPQVNSW